MNAQPEEDEFETVLQRAAYWSLRLGSDDCSPEERFAFEAWKRDDPANEAAYRKVQDGNAFVDQFITEPELRRLAQDAFERSEPHPKPEPKRRPWAAYTAIAASLIAICAVSLLAINPPGPSIGVDPLATEYAVADFDSYETEVGERSTATLADGTVITLNTNSKIEVRYSTNERLVTLVRGQGFFDVAKDIDRPFAVEAGAKRVVALGTAFDVRLDGDNDVEVVLVEGRVSVDDRDTAPEPIPSNPTAPPIVKTVELSPGQRFTSKRDAAAALEITDTQEATSWTEGRLIFRDKPLREVVAEMNRYSVQQLILSDDPRLEAMTVSGVFNTGRASTFVYALERMHPLDAERTSQTELTLVWQE